MNIMKMISIYLILLFASILNADVNIGGLATGQITSYVDYDDGYYQKGIKKEYQRDKTNEYVYDHNLNIFWQDNSSVASNKTNFYDAKNYCENLNLNGLSNWKLPTLRELQSIIDRSKYNPALNSEFQISSNDNYWSSSLKSDNNNAWYVNFSKGCQANSKTEQINSKKCYTLKLKPPIKFTYSLLKS